MGVLEIYFAGDPNIVGRDGSVPIMVCLVPLINKDQLHHFTHSMKVYFFSVILLTCVMYPHKTDFRCAI